MAGNFDSHLRIRLSSPYVCIGSHAFAIFAHKKNTGAQGTLTTLYRTWLFALYGSTIFDCVVVSDHFFLLTWVSLLEKKIQRSSGIRTHAHHSTNPSPSPLSHQTPATGSLDSMECGTVLEECGILEWWNERLTTLYCFYLYKWANWACTLAIDVEKHGMVWIPGYLLLENIDISTSWKSVLKLYEKEPVYVLLSQLRIAIAIWLTNYSQWSVSHINPWHI